MADDSSANGHSTDARYADLDDEVRGLESAVRLLAADQRAMRQSIDMLREQFANRLEINNDLLRHITKQLDEVLNNRDGYAVLKRLSALEERVTEKPKRIARGKR